MIVPHRSWELWSLRQWFWRQWSSRQSSWRHFAWLIYLTFPLLTFPSISIAKDNTNANESDDFQQQLLFFLDLTNRTPLNSVSTTDYNDQLIPALDISYSFSYDRFRFLTEYVASTTESEFERLQLGLALGEDSRLWFGRIHRPSRYWNSEYHHGRYLQTSISRPWIGEFEDESGPLITHITGLMLDAGFNWGSGAGMRFAASTGLSAVLEDELIPYELTDSGDGHKLGFDLRLGYLPDYFGQNEVGIVASYDEINVDLPSEISLVTNLNSIDQSMIGVYANWQFEQLTILTSAVHVKNQFHQTAVSGTTENSRFAYLQAEYEFAPSWRGFGRIERSWDAQDSLYLSLLPQVVANRELVGLRYDFPKQHALTLEFNRQKRRESHETQLCIQWSFVLP
jgi:hypothetical protein